MPRTKTTNAIRILLVAAEFSTLLCGAEGVRAADITVTNINSNVQTLKQWRRQYVLLSDFGELVDPSGTLISHARGKNMEITAESLTNITAAAYSGMTNGLQRLWSVTNQIPEHGIILGLTMNPGVGRTNIWFHAAAQSSDGTNDVAWYYSSYALSAMPHIQRRYYGETQTTFVEGEWIDWKNDSITTNGYPNCKRVKFVRPEFARGVTLVPNPHAKIGSPNGGFDFGNAVVTVNGRLTFTGYVTNGTKRIYFDNGVNKGEEDIEEDVP
nr:MAG TPA: hypothetical protein [Caudoviricetes sp.]